MCLNYIFFIELLYYAQIILYELIIFFSDPVPQQRLNMMAESAAFLFGQHRRNRFYNHILSFLNIRINQVGLGG
jgi:hypothetical protein